MSDARAVLVDASGSAIVDPAILMTLPNLHDPIAVNVTMRILSRDSELPPNMPRHLVRNIRSYETVRLWETRLMAEKRVYVYGKAGSLDGAVALRPGRRLTVFTTDEQGTVLARRESQVQSSRSLAVVLGVAGLIITGVATGLVFLVV